MKKVCISFFACIIIILSVIGIALPKGQEHKEYLRIHIRADSNSDEAQAIKYIVKDAVVEYLTPYIAKCDTKRKAQTLLTDRLKEIESVADKTLKEKGFNYKSSASVKKENFPTRVYGNLTLEKGYYDALIINLGSGKGDNWWCVVYPPLCFVNENQSGYVYESKIYQIIRDFFKNQDKEEK